VPELPEVQTVVDNLNGLGIGGSTITNASVHWPKTVAPITPAKFRKQIKGLRINRFSRRGKYVVANLSQGWTLLIHLRMTGRLNWAATGTRRGIHEHVVLQLDQANELRFHDTRKFGRLFLTQTPETVLAKIGPEPLEKSFTRKRLRHLLQGKRRQMKPLLLDQTFIAGLGNIYVDEALWSARIHPLRVSSSLTENEISALHKAIRLVLRRGLKNMGTSLGTGKGNFYSVAGRKGRNADELKVFRRNGEACPRCQALIERLNVAQRGTHICPVCQPVPKALQRQG